MQRFLQHRRLCQNTRHEVAKEKEHSDSTSKLTSLSPTRNIEQEKASESTLGDDLASRLDDIKPDKHDDSGRPKVLLVQGGSTPCTPRQWTKKRRAVNTVFIFLVVAATGWTSAADSDVNRKAAKEFHVTKEVETLSTAMFLWGTALGSLFSGPISETIGRSAAYLGFTFIYLIMVLITALAPNFTVQIIFRFLAGLTASPAMTIYGGSLADLFSNEERSLVWPLFALGPILGPILAPVAGGWIIEPSWISWRWIVWTALIISTVIFILAFLLINETYKPILLKWKAESFRRETGDDRFKSEQELGPPFMERLMENASKPVVFFTKEPIVIAIGLYLTFIWALVFTFLEGFTFIFIDTYSFTPGLRGTAFLAIVVGILLNTALTLQWNQKTYLSALKEAAREQNIDEDSDEEPKLAPEIRLLPAVYCAPLLPISLFWLGWTNFSSISPWSNLLAACLFGFSLMGIFVSSYQYIIDAYETSASSALSSITFLRYGVAGGMSLATQPMYKALGVHYVMTLMGGVGVLLVPVPFLLWKYGDKVRKRSKYAIKF